MRELQSKQRIKRRMYSTPALIGLAILTLILMRGAYSVTSKMLASKAYVSELENKVDTLKSRQAELQENIAKLQTTEGVDSEIKGKFSVSKEGEKVAVIVDARSLDKSSTTPDTTFFGKIWKTVSGLWR